MKTICNLLKCFFICLLMGISFTGCKDDDSPSNPTPDPSSSSGVYVLNQGKIGKNNAGLTFRNFESGTVTADLMKGTMGDNAMDVASYGSKLYVTVSGSSVLMIFDLKTKTKIAQTELKDEQNNPREPRYLAFNGGKVYVSTYDGNVVRLDTTNFAVEAVAKVGPNPEGIACVDGKLYVANSGGMSQDGKFNNTVSIVNVASFKEEETITVGVNPTVLKADKSGNIYLVSVGNYYDVSGKFQRIDTKTNTVRDVENVNVSNFTIVGDLCYFYGVTYAEDWSTSCNFGIYNVNTQTLSSTQLIADGTKINTAYGIGVDPATKDVYISDTDYLNPGTIYVFDQDGKKKTTFEVGINPCQFFFY